MSEPFTPLELFRIMELAIRRIMELEALIHVRKDASEELEELQVMRRIRDKAYKGMQHGRAN